MYNLLALRYSQGCLLIKSGHHLSVAKSDMWFILCIALQRCCVETGQDHRGLEPRNHERRGMFELRVNTKTVGRQRRVGERGLYVTDSTRRDKTETQQTNQTN